MSVAGSSAARPGNAVAVAPRVRMVALAVASPGALPVVLLLASLDVFAAVFRVAFTGAASRSGTTLSGISSTTLNALASRTKSSFSLISSQGGCFSSRPFIRISAHLPCILRPCISNLSMPSRQPAFASPIGVQVPSSQMMTLPAPYWPAGICPSKRL